MSGGTIVIFVPQVFVEWPPFDRASLTAVIINCVILAGQGPPGTYAWIPEAHSDTMELSFTLLFTTELVCKVAAMGFRGHEWAYLGSAW